ncbi:MAG: tetratricopeptide repeat protein, partial [Bacteroidales bacterium]|nr:tetratricopeptide repeat protein [Bacteroidales bacterium]
MVRRGHLLFSSADYAEALKANDSAISFISKYINKNFPHTESPIQRKRHKRDYTARDNERAAWERLSMEALSNKGLTLIYCNQSNLASETFLEILDLYGQTADSNNIAIAKSYNGMGITFAHRNQPDVGLPYFRKSLEIYESLNDQRGIYLLNS